MFAIRSPGGDAKRGRERKCSCPAYLYFNADLVGLSGQLVNFDPDLAGFCCFLLRQRDGQDAVLVFGTDFIGFDRVWERKAADKFSVTALDTVIALHAGVLLEFAGATEGHGAVFDADVEVFGFDVGEVSFQGEGVFGFDDIDGWRPRPAGAGFIHQAGDGVFEEAKALEGIGCECCAHGYVVPFG
jgi:hypothetical protein